MINREELIKIVVVVMVAGAIFMGVRHFRNSDDNVKIQTMRPDAGRGRGRDAGTGSGKGNHPGSGTGTTYTDAHGHTRNVYGDAE